MNRFSRVVAAPISSLSVSAIFFSISAYNDFPASNQNMHALHASVLSGLTPALSEDWLYTTTDPFPLATWITALFLKLGPGGIYFLYFVTIATFIAAVVTFLDHNDRKDALASYLWRGLIVLSALVLGRLTGLSAGVAGQYILGEYWQPSEAGVFLVLSILLFASRWPTWSAACAALAVALHPSIALGALILQTAASIRLVVERQWKELFVLGGVFTVLVLPPLTHTLIQFMPTTDELANKASRVLTRDKIPFHAIPTQWVTTLDILKVFMIALAAYICRRQHPRLSSILFISLILGIVTTVIFSYLDDNRLLLLFPWRVSAVLAPIALILIVSAVFNGLPNKWIYNNQKLIFIPILVLAASVQFMKIYYDYPGFMPAYWIGATFTGDDYNVKVQDRLDRMDVINWAKRRQDPMDVYLVPLDFEQFRIMSGRPIFVDWKSHPFKDTEVIEWERRLGVAEQAFKSLRECKKIDSNEFNMVIVDNSSSFYNKVAPGCSLYTEKQINSRFGFVKLR